MRLRDFTTLSFDCYGTLIDWESGILENLRPLTSRIERTLSGDDILEAHARHESRHQAQTPERLYRKLLRDVYADLAKEWGVDAGEDECREYGLSVRNWPAFPDSAEALAYLKKHYKLVILSNVDRQSFQASNEKLGVEFDVIVTAEDAGAYKPSPKNFHHMLDVLLKAGIGKSDILHTAESMFHDHEPANDIGLVSCHIYRRHAREGFGATMKPRTRPSCAFRFNSMLDMATAHENEPF